MSLRDKTVELTRLIEAFETEAGKFHPLSLSLEYITQSEPSYSRQFAKPNHAIMLWQYYGAIQGSEDAERLARNGIESNLQWGLRGADLSCFGVLEGEGCELFIRMAQRAGALFDEAEANSLKSQVVDELLAVEQKRHVPAKPVATSNNNALALWINYLLYHLSMTNPGRERAIRIEPDPFSLSLLALERLFSERAIGKIDRSVRSLAGLQFQVALSFPGEQRIYVSSVVDELRPHLPPDAIFYDLDYQAQLAKPNLDVLLQDIYRNRSELIVVFLCEKYAEKQWCGLEWRAIRELIKLKKDDQIMLVRFDDATIEGIFSTDGYIDARNHKPAKLAGARAAQIWGRGSARLATGHRLANRTPSSAKGVELSYASTQRPLRQNHRQPAAMRRQAVHSRLACAGERRTRPAGGWC
jgi:TIR domain